MPRLSRYFFFFAIQTVGAVILLSYSIPLYRQVIVDPGGYKERPARLIWSLVSIGLMQAGYWMRHRFNPQLPSFRNALIGHIILFVASLSFIFASAMFGFAFITPRPEFRLPFSRYLVLIAGLFAWFCYVQELARLGRGTQRSEANTGRYRMSYVQTTWDQSPIGRANDVLAGAYNRSRCRVLVRHAFTTLGLAYFKSVTLPVCRS